MNEKWATRLKIKRISKYVMIFSLVFLLILSGFTLYGDKVGNFVVVLREDKVKIAACLSKDFERDATTYLSIPGVDKLDATTYADIPDTLTAGAGVKHGEKGKYMAFSFYLLNRTESAITYDVSLKIIDELAGKGNTTYKPSDALRVLILEENEMNGELEGNKNLKADGTVYAKSETSEGAVRELEKAHYPQDKVVDFLTEDKTIIKRQGIPFEQNAVTKYTVVMWLEGWDISCKDELIGSRLKMEMNFDAYVND